MNTKFSILCLVAMICLGCSNMQTQETKRHFPSKNGTHYAERQMKHMQERLMLDDKTAEKFEPLYKEYLQALKACIPNRKTDVRRKERSDEQIERDLKNRFETQRKLLDVKETYFARFRKILNARQLEMVFNSPHVKKVKAVKARQTKKMEHKRPMERKSRF